MLTGAAGTLWVGVGTGVGVTRGATTTIVGWLVGVAAGGGAAGGPPLLEPVEGGRAAGLGRRTATVAVATGGAAFRPGVDVGTGAWSAIWLPALDGGGVETGADGWRRLWWRRRAWCALGSGVARRGAGAAVGCCRVAGTETRVACGWCKRAKARAIAARPAPSGVSRRAGRRQASKRDRGRVTSPSTRARRAGGGATAGRVRKSSCCWA